MWHSGQQYNVEPSKAVVKRISPGLGLGFFSFSGFFFFFFLGGLDWTWAVLIDDKLLMELVPNVLEFVVIFVFKFVLRPFTFNGLLWSRFKLGSLF